MNKKPRVVAFLPAKGNSERVPSKNMKLLDGKPLFLHTLEKLCDCDFIDDVYLDTESDVMLGYAPHLRYKPFKRAPELASNKATGDMLLYNEANLIEADIYVQVMCPLPFIRKETIQKGISILLESNEYDSVILVKKDRLYQWEDGKPAYYVDGRIPNSFDLPDIISETFGLHIIKRETILEKRCHLGDKPYLLYADPIETVDINYITDFEVAEWISKGMAQEESLYFESMKHFFNSSVFSDILVDMGLPLAITGMTLNLQNKKVMGRANTLKIRALREGESYKGIYEALNTYKEMRRGEIIVVENELPDLAYFGEINANLAIRSGAAATIVGGKTRDIEKVTSLDYPVFSMGYSCRDVRGAATFGEHNKPVVIHGVTVNPGDLIFADINGIAVIPRSVEKEVMDKAIGVISKEKGILDKILKRQEAFSIYESDGEF